MVFPAQSGSKLWPSLCAFRNPAHCHSDSLPCFSNSISPCALSHLVLVPQRHSDPLSTHRTSCSRYSDIWECSSNLKHLNYCTADPAQQENASAGANRPAEGPRQDLLDVAAGGEDICIFSLLAAIKVGREASHLRPHEASPFISAVQLVCVPSLRLD